MTRSWITTAAEATARNSTTAPVPAPTLAEATARSSSHLSTQDQAKPFSTSDVILQTFTTLASIAKSLTAGFPTPKLSTPVADPVDSFPVRPGRENLEQQSVQDGRPTRTSIHQDASAWSPREVAACLLQNGFIFSETLPFMANGIDGPSLLEMSPGRAREIGLPDQKIPVLMALIKRLRRSCTNNTQPVEQKRLRVAASLAHLRDSASTAEASSDKTAVTAFFRRCRSFEVSRHQVDCTRGHNEPSPRRKQPPPTSSRHATLDYFSSRRHPVGGFPRLGGRVVVSACEDSGDDNTLTEGFSETDARSRRLADGGGLGVIE
ncbi:hypothetical protein DFJ73DRAFT_756926 [Zopfochytrium polystomum]|nr:hypothetical protein DFJ73DRAFT_756926 [Zopfochytrium polystomum]